MDVLNILARVRAGCLACRGIDDFHYDLRQEFGAAVNVYQRDSLIVAMVAACVTDGNDERSKAIAVDASLPQIVAVGESGRHRRDGIDAGEEVGGGGAILSTSPA